MDFLHGHAKYSIKKRSRGGPFFIEYFIGMSLLYAF